MSKQFRSLHVGAGAVRHETFEGRKHLVVPIVALVEGVVHAMNAPAPEYVPSGEFSKQPTQWDGRPIFLGHPVDDQGRPVSGTTPSVLERSIGKVFHAKTDGNRLLMEGWVDVLKAEQLEPGIVARLERLEPEVSVGTYVTMGDDSGDFNGIEYKGSWRDIFSNHLAILKPGDEGACSRKMGCGVRAAQIKGEQDVKTDDKKNSAGFFTKLKELLVAAGVNTDEAGLDERDLAAYGGKAHLVQQMHDNSVQMGAACKGARSAGEHDDGHECGCGGKKDAAAKTHKW